MSGIMTDIRGKIIKDTFVCNRPKCLSKDESSQAFEMWVRSIRERAGETDSNTASMSGASVTLDQEN